MPIAFISQAFSDGLSSVPYAQAVLRPLLRAAPWLLVLYLLKRYFGGAVNTSERNMHSKVVMMTGGTSGIGAEVARELAQRGAQLVLLTQHPLTDPFLAEHILDLRAATGNQLITAERVDLASLHSIRVFATRWVDNAPPRRLDMVILCGSTLTPPGARAAEATEDGVELNWGVNYLANFHLLSILSPALRAQPPDREVRVIFGTCASYMGGELPDLADTTLPSEPAKGTAKPQAGAKPPQRNRPSPTKKLQTQIPYSPASAYAASKLALTTFAAAFQKHLAAYKRPDGFPGNAHVVLVDPGWTRTPGMRRHLTRGSLLGLLGYLVLWPLAWLVLKSPTQGAQSFLRAAMEAELGRGEGGRLVKECRVVKVMRGEVEDESVQRGLWQGSERTVEELEKRGAARRAREKKEREAEEGKAGGDEGSKEEDEKADGGTASGASDGKKPGSRRSRKGG